MSTAASVASSFKNARGVMCGSPARGRVTSGLNGLRASLTWVRSPSAGGTLAPTGDMWRARLPPLSTSALSASTISMTPSPCLSPVAAPARRPASSRVTTLCAEHVMRVSSAARESRARSAASHAPAGSSSSLNALAGASCPLPAAFI